MTDIEDFCYEILTVTVHLQYGTVAAVGVSKHAQNIIVDYTLQR